MLPERTSTVEHFHIAPLVRQSPPEGALLTPVLHPVDVVVRDNFLVAMIILTDDGHLFHIEPRLLQFLNRVLLASGFCKLLQPNVFQTLCILSFSTSICVAFPCQIRTSQGTVSACAVFTRSSGLFLKLPPEKRGAAAWLADSPCQDWTVTYGSHVLPNHTG